MPQLYRRLLFVIALISASTATASVASAATLSTLYSFCPQTNCADGTNPISKLLIDSAGNLYGETYAGGIGNDGTIFEMERKNGGFVYRRIYAFCPGADCTTGLAPYDVSGLIMDTAGNLYGTTASGGAANDGVAFELIPARNIRSGRSRYCTRSVRKRVAPMALNHWAV